MNNIIAAILIGACLSFPTPDVKLAPTDQVRAVSVISQIDETCPLWSASYEANEFDCSEMSAYVSNRLTIMGIENEIKVGKCPEYCHAWVELTDGTVIECTKLIVFADDKTYCFQGQPYIKSYSELTPLSKRNLNSSEWDWWNSSFFN